MEKHKSKTSFTKLAKPNDATALFSPRANAVLEN